MPPPAAYANEDALATELHGRLGRLASILGWTVVGNSYDLIIADALDVMSADTITELTSQEQIRQLRAASLWKLWEYAVDALVANYRFASDFQTFERQQIFDHAEKALRRAIVRCAQVGISVPGLTGVIRVPRFDPYQVAATTSSDEFGA